jgi:hypothetical protein
MSGGTGARGSGDLGLAAREGTAVGAVAAGVAASFGLVVSSALVAVVVAGGLQWMNVPVWLDNGIPLAVLAGGLVLSGRVATDVAGRFGPWCGVGAALLVGLVGTAVSRAGEAHGDGVEPVQIVVAVAAVMVLSAGSAWWIARRRMRRGSSE